MFYPIKMTNVYYPDGQIKYNGRLFNNKRSGFGTLYVSNGNIFYQDTWIDNKRSGSCKLFYSDGSLKYDSDWKDDCYHGYSTFMITIIIRNMKDIGKTINII